MAKRRKSPMPRAITSPYDCLTYTRTETADSVIETAYGGAWEQITPKDALILPDELVYPWEQK